MKTLTAIPITTKSGTWKKCWGRCAASVRKSWSSTTAPPTGRGKLLTAHRDIRVITHAQNRGYGAALVSAFQYALQERYEVLVTMDCDGQHEPSRIPVLLEAIHDADIVSGSRYLRDFRQNSFAPEDRRRINQIVTAELNKQFGLSLTDAFCGFKAYRATALGKLNITESGWGMPLQLWVQAALAGCASRRSPCRASTWIPTGPLAAC